MFVERILSEGLAHYSYLMPPYFRMMEQINLAGGAPAPRSFSPRPLTLAELQDTAPDWLVDTRPTTAFLGAHVPNALSLPLSILSSFAGWFLRDSDSIVLASSDAAEAGEAVRRLARIGFDHVVGLAPSIVAAAAAGAPFAATPAADLETVAQRLRARPEGWTLLDVRSAEEIEAYTIAGPQCVYVGKLPEQVGELDPKRWYTVMCASGVRATTAASYLRSCGFEKVDVFLGSAGAWRAREQSLEQ